MFNPIKWLTGIRSTKFRLGPAEEPDISDTAFKGFMMTTNFLIMTGVWITLIYIATH